MFVSCFITKKTSIYIGGTVFIHTWPRVPLEVRECNYAFVRTIYQTRRILTLAETSRYNLINIKVEKVAVGEIITDMVKIVRNIVIKKLNTAGILLAIIEVEAGGHI